MIEAPGQGISRKAVRRVDKMNQTGRQNQQNAGPDCESWLARVVWNWNAWPRGAVVLSNYEDLPFTPFFSAPASSRISGILPGLSCTTSECMAPARRDV